MRACFMLHAFTLVFMLLAKGTCSPMTEHTHRYEQPDLDAPIEAKLIADEPPDFHEEDDEWKELSNKPWNLY